jgi:hypothetical protein
MDEMRAFLKGWISFGVVWAIIIALFLVFGNNPYIWALAIVFAIFTAFSLYDDWKDSRQPVKDGRTQVQREVGRQDALVRQEQEYLSWCEPQTKEEKVLQKLADGLLEIYDWDGMPKIKARLNPDIKDKEDKVAHYCHGFEWSTSFDGAPAHFREQGKQVIEFKPSYYHSASVKELKSVMKHELIHAWVDWMGLGYGDSVVDKLVAESNKHHGPYFVWKSIELGDENEMAGTFHHYPGMQIVYDKIRAGGNDTYNSISRSVELAKKKRNA